MLALAILALLPGPSFVLTSLSIPISFVSDGVICNSDNFDFFFPAKVSNIRDEILILLNNFNTLLTPNWPTTMFHLSNAQGRTLKVYYSTVIPGFKRVAVQTCRQSFRLLRKDPSPANMLMPSVCVFSWVE